MNKQHKQILVWTLGVCVAGGMNIGYAAQSVTEPVTQGNITSEPYASINVQTNPGYLPHNELDGIASLSYMPSSNLQLNVTDDSLIRVYHARSDIEEGVHAHGAYIYGLNNSLTISNSNKLVMDVTAINSNPVEPLVNANEKYASAVGIYSVNGSVINVGANIQMNVLADAQGVETSAKSIGVVAYSADGEAGSRVTFQGNTVINVTALVEDSGSIAHEDHDNSVGYAHGVHVNAVGATVNFLKDVEINAIANLNTYALNNNMTTAYALYSGYRSVNSNIYINTSEADPSQTLGNTVKLQGDIVANNGNIYISLPNQNSYLYGTVLQRKYDELTSTNTDGRVYLSLNNGAKWMLKANSYSEQDTPVLTLAGGIIQVHDLQVANASLVDLTTDSLNRQDNWRTLTFDTRPEAAGNGSAFSINGSDNTFVINSDIANNLADKLVISSNSGNNYIKVNYDPTYAAGDKEISTTKTLVVQAVGNGNFSGTFSGAAHDNGVYQWTPNIKRGALLNNPVPGEENNFYIVGESKAPSSVVTGHLNMTSAMLSAFRLSNQNLVRRMGELRENSDKAGIWLRYYTGESDLLGGLGSQRYNALQGGFDRVQEGKDGSKIFRGLALEQLVANNSFYEGSGRITNIDLGLYQVWLGNKGHYYDLVGKLYRLSSQMSIHDTDNNLVQGNYKTWATELSLEYGRRKELGSGYFIQPQAQLTYRRINAASYTASNNVFFEQKSVNSLVGRAGIMLGKKCDDKSQIFLEANILRELFGNAKVLAKDDYGNNLWANVNSGETWYNLAVGANLKVNKKTDMYVLLEKDLGSKISNAWQAQIGARWSW